MQRIAFAEPPLSLLAEGPEDGPLVICLHGFPDIPRGYEGLMRALAAEGYRVVAPWMPGYSPSGPAPTYDPSSNVERILALANRLSPERKVDVVGHDWGAVVAYELLGRYPERFRRAVTMAVPHSKAFVENVPRHPEQLAKSWYMLFFQLPLLSTAMVKRNDFAFIDMLWARWSPGYRPAPDYMAELKQCLAASMPAPILYYRHAARALSGQVKGEPSAVDLRVPVPTLYLHGEHDGCVGRELAEGQAQMFDEPLVERVIPGAGHFLHLERPREVEASVVDWLSRD